MKAAGEMRHAECVEHEKATVEGPLIGRRLRWHLSALPVCLDNHRLAEGEGGNTPSLDARLSTRVAARRFRQVASARQNPLSQQGACKRRLLICGPALGPEMPDAARYGAPEYGFPYKLVPGLHAVAPVVRSST
jgi:hypothetical protein